MPIAEIFFGEQDLGNFDFMRTEQSFVGFHQQAWPTEAQACLVAMSFKREGWSPSHPRPRPTAPEETKTTRRPLACRAAMERTIGSTRSKRKFTLRASDGGGAQLDDHAPGVAQEAVLGLIAVVKRIADLLRLKLIDYDI